MRADRLIQIVLLLQKRHAMTARELAAELGVSRRTIFRDMDTLDRIGIPVFADYGSDGGYRLVEGYRTSLNGLTREEVGALLTLTFPEPLADLDIGQKLKSALLKLYAAHSPALHHVYLDWTAWGGGHESAPHLQKLYRAIQENHKIAIYYRLWDRVDIRREVEPYGLVAKAGVWHLIYAGNGGLRYQCVSEFISVTVLDEPFVRPPDFELEAYWKGIGAEFAAESARFRAVLRVDPALLPWLPHLLGRDTPVGNEAEGWARLELCFDSFEAARKQILALGGAVEVLEPEALRLSVQDFAAQILQVYARAGTEMRAEPRAPL